MLSAEIKDNISEQERVFGISRNNKGLLCPFKRTLCQEGYCSECQIYLDWQKQGGRLLTSTRDDMAALHMFGRDTPRPD